MGAVAQNDVQQDQSHLRVGHLLSDPADPHVVVDHRVQAADRVFVRPKIEDRVSFAARYRFQGPMLECSGSRKFARARTDSEASVPPENSPRR